jgi:hypothetical protein
MVCGLALLVAPLVLGCHGDRGTASGGGARGSEIETVVMGRPFEHTFVVPNKTRDTLVVKQVIASAGVITHADSVLPPHSEGRFIVRFDKTPYLGVISEAIRVEFAGNEPPQRVRILKRVVAPVEVAPQSEFYFFTARGEPAERELTIINHLDQPLRIVKVSSSDPAFRPALSTLESGRRYQVRVSLDTTTGVGKHEGTIRLTTDVPAYATLDVQGHAVVKDVVNASIDELDYSRVEAAALDREALGERTVLVRKYRGRDFQVVRATTTLPFLAVRVEPQTAGESYFVHVRIQRDRAPKGRFSGALRIETNDSTTRELKLPIHGEIL